MAGLLLRGYFSYSTISLPISILVHRLLPPAALPIQAPVDARVILPPHGCERCYPNTERFRHRRKLRLVREVGLEEVLGLGNASDFRSDRVRPMRDLSLPGRPRGPRQGGEYPHVWTRRRPNRRQRRLDVRVGGRR